MTLQAYRDEQTRLMDAEAADMAHERFGQPQPVRADYVPFTRIDWHYYSPERVAARNAAN
jgi:hypothetical protein